MSKFVERIPFCIKMARKMFNDKSIAIEKTLPFCTTDEQRAAVIEAADKVFAVPLEEILIQIEIVDNLMKESEHLRGVNAEGGSDDLDRLYLSAVDAVGKI